MQLISKSNKRIRFLLCVIDVFSKYTWTISLKDKKGITITNAFQKILDKDRRKQSKIWVNKGSEFYNRSVKSWIPENNIEMYSIHNEEKSVVAGRYIRILKTKIYKYMTSVSRNVYIDELDDILNKYSNTYHRTIKMKPVDIKDNTYIDFDKENNDKYPKFKVADHVRISKFKGNTLFWFEEVFVIKKLKNTVPWTYVFNDLNGEEIVGTFYEKELQKTSQKEFRKGKSNNEKR